MRIEPKPVIALDWYRAFIQGLLDAAAYMWFAKVISVSETLIGVALILGAFTGLRHVLRRTAELELRHGRDRVEQRTAVAISTWLVLAWKTAGWIGLDATCSRCCYLGCKTGLSLSGPYLYWPAQETGPRPAHFMSCGP